MDPIRRGELPAPQFPDRPFHPDFWLLSEIARTHDSAAEGGQNPVEIAGADEGSLLYLARNRIGMLLQHTGGRLDETSLLAVYLDGFATGKAFAERGGHQEP